MTLGLVDSPPSRSDSPPLLEPLDQAQYGRMGTLVLILDLIGTFVFALSGATMGVRRRLDIFGVLVLSFAAALAGGITRDLLIGATPVAAISDWRYPAITLAAGIVTFFWAPLIERMQYPVRMFKIRTG